MFKIYWTTSTGAVGSVDTADLNEALSLVTEARNAGHGFVTMAGENAHQVGKPGVDAVVDGKTPDGQPYDWTKSGRAGKPRKSDKAVTVDDH